jgi:hypothetical protein
MVSDFGCAAHRLLQAQGQSRAPYVSLTEVEKVFGPIVTAGNHPTADKMGTGDRLGLVRDSDGTIWGLPLTITADGNVMICAPSTLRHARIPDHYPAGATVIGATNEPTGWRGGTGKLELLLRQAQGNIEWPPVKGSHIDVGPVCWAQEPPPGPKQLLVYYRLAPAEGK